MFNVGKHSTLAQFEKILKSNGVEYKRAKKTPSITHGVLTFEVYLQWPPCGDGSHFFFNTSRARW